MDTVQKMIQAIAAILWPLIVIVLVLQFRPALGAIIASAKSRKFTLKIGGQELTMEEANQQQQNLIADLQAKVTEIESRLTISSLASLPSKFPVPDISLIGPLSPAPSPAKSPHPAPSRPLSAVLWVDDNPKNNSYFIQQLTDSGVRVDLSKSTSEGRDLFDAKKYDLVISDMGRMEGISYNSTAGIDLLKLVREKDKDIPFVIFGSERGKSKYGAEALRLGATAVISSSTDLFGILKISGAKKFS